ncbi:TetR family transcriptional regulator [Mycobacterium sp. MS1601]|nr:TetR family transcriptional regulator [Mycobacterium sp. MS1601]
MPRTGERGGPKTRARISNIATQMFIDKGFDAVTVAQVAKAAGVSSVTVFNHFPRKEDLLLDRADETADLLRAAIRNRAPGVDVLTSLRALARQLTDQQHALSGIADGAAPFFRTVAASPALIARSREIAAELEATLRQELERDTVFDADSTLLAAFVIAGYTTVLTETARKVIAGTPNLAVDHRARVEKLFDALRTGFSEGLG